jgi:RecA-family ATPase
MNSTTCAITLIGLHTNPSSYNMQLNDKILNEICRKFQPVVIVDSLVDYIPIGRSEQDPATMREVMAGFTKLIISGATAVVLLHHTPKDGEDYRGTTGQPLSQALPLSLQH